MSFLFRRKKKDDEAPVDPNARSEKLGIRYKDLAVLGQLMQQGADLTKPRHALYYLYFKSEESANAAAAEIGPTGYSCDVHETPSQPGSWSLICQRDDAVLDPPGVIAADNLFQGVADRHQAEYDGWEAAARP
jgi:hypothetical protein